MKVARPNITSLIEGVSKEGRVINAAWLDRQMKWDGIEEPKSFFGDALFEQPIMKMKI